MSTNVEKDGLRIRGDEQNVEGARHRARYRWASQQVRGLRVLDYGCGTGYGCLILAERAQGVYGFDPDVDAIRFGKYRWWSALTADLTKIPEPDAVVALEVLEHLPEHPRETVAHLLALAPLVVASVPFNEPAGRNPHHVHALLTPEALAQEGVRYEFFSQMLPGDVRPGVLPGAVNLLFVAQRG